MRQQRLRLGGCAVQPVAQQPGGIAVEKAQRRFHQVGHSSLADIAGRAEGRQMRAHQRREIDRDAREGKCKGHPAIAGNGGRFRPVRRRGDQIPRRQPDAEIRRHPKRHGDAGQAKPQKGQLSVIPRVAQQGGQVIGFLFLFHPYASSLHKIFQRADRSAICS